ncbi:TIR domain-containing protein [Mesorhizobium sp.]|uniref:TIR domain-containing protein n=1 Tax=Mesorhizobium sp. TaxID=1871066 RepID=UPI000FE97497|nr:TIR domain-containing protein [Mesorhizobium sp.]RWP35310.1 MAG: hypothetical protein EOR03_13095 [Mesorhizobium sp.]
MSGIQFGSSLRIQPSVKRKIFVSYHHGGDQAYYDAFSKAFHNNYDALTDNSLDRAVDSDDVDYVMRRIREKYITGSSCTVVLVGKDTWGRKYVDWEIDVTLQRQHGLIGVMLPSLPIDANGKVSTPARLQDNINSGYAVWVHWNTFTASAEACAGYIEQANVREKKMMVNTRDRRLRNV